MAAAFQMLIAYIIFAALLGIIAAIYVFPVLSVVLAVIFIIRRKKADWKSFRVPVFLLLASLICWSVWNLFIYGTGYLFHHDFGSKVYNEGYIIPHYEKMYGDSLELVDKKVTDSCNAAYTLRSEITGQLFTVTTNYFDEGSGAFDRLHLSADYEDVLAERLLSGEKICLPFEELSGARLDGRLYQWYAIVLADHSFFIHIYTPDNTTRQQFDQQIQEESYYISLEGNNLVFEIPAKDGSLIAYPFALIQN